MSAATGGRNEDDVAPGFLGAEGRTVWQGVRSYLVGLVLAAALTAGSFVVVGSPLIWGPTLPVALLILMVAQIGVHLVFFLHITTAPDHTNNVLALAFGVLIVVLVVGGSLWIMGHLNHRMLPMYQLVQMQG
ncbi:MAG: cytochrome o ubiquinol oxidase subunit IV [Acetobacteraceae bacterium]|nr:cytochrome o ubiquinol oxidase subunit IV [Acetobacteraceae bacterium]